MNRHRTASGTDAVVSLTIEHGPYRGVVRAELLRRTHAMIEALQLQNVELSIVLTDDNGIHYLNKIYRHKDRPTDVLAFAMREGDFGALAGDVLGDIIVSVETARKQAHERGVTVLEEVTMLTAHGLLHLLGWDHDTPAKDRRMRAETDRLCQAARPVGRSAPRTPRRAPPAEMGPSAPQRRRSKAGATPALTRKRPALNPRKAARKVESVPSTRARGRRRA